MKLEKIKIQLDYLSGPIWPNYLEGKTFRKITGVKIVDDDSKLSELNQQACDMYSSYYEFNTHGVACWFNHEKEKAEKGIMLDLISQIVARLNEINDGSFVVEDLETKRLLAL